MLTKTGEQIKEAFITGLVSASRLNDQDKANLSGRYGLSPNANFRTRNMGRSLVGGIAGGGIGTVIGGAIGSLGGPIGTMVGARLGGLAGGAIGDFAASRKYSKGAAAGIADQNKMVQRAY